MITLRPVALMLALAPTVSAQSTWYVDLNATPPGNGSPGSPYASIQYAIQQPGTLPGDTLSIAPGTYTETLGFQGKALRLVGEQGRDVTIIEGGATVDGGTDIATEIEGLTISGAYLGVYGSLFVFFDSMLVGGSGLYAEDGEISLLSSTFMNINASSIGSPINVFSGSLVIEDCLFKNNRGGEGTAIRIQGYFSCKDTRFENNTTTSSNLGSGTILGGSGGTIERCEFIGGRADYGGGLTWGACDVMDCYFEGNQGYAWGGAIYAYSGRVRDCVFVGNHGGRGGAVYDADIEDSVFIGNFAECDKVVSVPLAGYGGAISNGTATRCVFIDNQSWDCDDPKSGGTAYQSTLVNCLIAGSDALDDLAEAAHESDLINCIVIDSSGPPLLDSTATYSLIQGGHPGIGNIDGDPLLVDLAGGDYGLWPGSPCIDAGDPTMFDPDGTRSDMGPFPFSPVTYCTAKVNSQGCTPSIGSSGSPRLTGPDDFYVTASNVLPGEWGILAWAGGTNDLPFFGGTLCLQAPIVRTAPQQATGAGGCNGELSFHFSQAYMDNQLLLAYDQVYAQWWMRDPGLNPGVGLTDGLAVEVLP